MNSISTHILDTALGKPAAGVGVSLARKQSDGSMARLSENRTDDDGRVSNLLPRGEALAVGLYSLNFETAAYFEETGRESFYPSVEITFHVTDADQHYHVPLLLSPFGYSTYRGS